MGTCSPPGLRRVHLRTFLLSASACVWVETRLASARLCRFFSEATGTHVPLEAVWGVHVAKAAAELELASHPDAEPAGVEDYLS